MTTVVGVESPCLVPPPSDSAVVELFGASFDSCGSTLVAVLTSVGVAATVIAVVGAVVVLFSSSFGGGWVSWPGFCQTDTSAGPIEGNNASRTAHAAPEVPTMMPNHNAVTTTSRDERRVVRGLEPDECSVTSDP